MRFFNTSAGCFPLLLLLLPKCRCVLIALRNDVLTRQLGRHCCCCCCFCCFSISAIGGNRSHEGEPVASKNSKWDPFNDCWRACARTQNLSKRPANGMPIRRDNPRHGVPDANGCSACLWC